jgi:hypothetical protein
MGGRYDRDADFTPEQRAKFHAMCRDIARQLTWAGSRWTEEDWKRLFLGAKFGQPVVPNPFTHGMCVMNAKRFRDLDGDQVTELIGEVEAFGANNGVDWSEDE